jgi:hypothetical protein
MRLIIDRASGAVTIDGTTHVVDCTTVQPEIARVEWHDDWGSISYNNGKERHGISDIRKFKDVIDLWTNAQNPMRTR